METTENRERISLPLTRLKRLDSEEVNLFMLDISCLIALEWIGVVEKNNIVKELSD